MDNLGIIAISGFIKKAFNPIGFSNALKKLTIPNVNVTTKPDVRLINSVAINTGMCTVVGDGKGAGRGISPKGV